MRRALRNALSDALAAGLGARSPTRQRRGSWRTLRDVLSGRFVTRKTTGFERTDNALSDALHRRSRDGRNNTLLISTYERVSSKERAFPSTFHEYAGHGAYPLAYNFLALAPL